VIRDSIYDVIVIGGGHAGVEAALSTARAGYETLMLTMSARTICQMSCNPAIGGIAKGQMVREIDALGGEMAKAIDATGIQFRMLNRSKGPAMWSPRAQADKQQYQRYMQRVIEATPRLTLIEAEVSELIIEEGAIKGVRESGGKSFWGRFVIVTTGTFLKGLIHVGDENKTGGRRGESSAQYLSDSLRQAGIQLGRFKTGTPPRLKHESIDYSALQAQPGEQDNSRQPFPFPSLQWSH